MLKNQKNNQSSQIKKIVASAAAILVLGLVIFFSNNLTSPKNVFSGMIDNSLTTYSVTKSIRQAQGNVDIDRRVQLINSSNISTRSVTKLKQSAGEQSTKVTTENIVTHDQNLSRYISIDSKEADDQKKPDYSKILGVWFNDEANTKELNSQVIADAKSIVPGYVAGSPPIMNLNNVQKQKAKKIIYEKKVYKPDYSQVKTINYNGKKAYEYPVSVDVGAYIELINSMADVSGLKVQKINSSDYAQNPPLQLNMTISVYGHQLLEVKDLASDRQEMYLGYGVRTDLEIPQALTTSKEIEASLQKTLKD